MTKAHNYKLLSLRNHHTAYWCTDCGGVKIMTRTVAHEPWDTHYNQPNDPISHKKMPPCPAMFKMGDKVEVLVSGVKGAEPRWDPAVVEDAPCGHGYMVSWEDPEWAGTFWADVSRVRARTKEESNGMA